jgi:hypothetical protein
MAGNGELGQKRRGLGRLVATTFFTSCSMAVCIGLFVISLTVSEKFASWRKPELLSQWSAAGIR